MNFKDNQDMIRTVYFTSALPRLTRLASRFVDDPKGVISEAARIFDEMLPQMAYRDDPDRMLAPALFTCNVNIALYLALKNRGVSAHEFGRAMIDGLRRAPVNPGSRDQLPVAERLSALKKAADQSQTGANQGEDVFEAVASIDGSFDWGFDVTACSIHQSASRHGVAEITPYFCVVDDLLSQRAGDGLRRTGTIALGARRCDFRYREGGQPLPLAGRYPAAIQLDGE